MYVGQCSSGGHVWEIGAAVSVGCHCNQEAALGLIYMQMEMMP